MTDRIGRAVTQERGVTAEAARQVTSSPSHWVGNFAEENCRVAAAMWAYTSFAMSPDLPAQPSPPDGASPDVFRKPVKPVNNLPAGIPVIPDPELIRCIGSGSYGEVWLARNVIGQHRAIKIVRHCTFEDARIDVGELTTVVSVY